MMKNKLFLFLLTGCVVLSLGVNAQKQQRQVDGFDQVSLGIAADLYLRQASGFGLELEGDSDDLEDITTEVRNGTLVISYERNRGWSVFRDRVTIYLSMPEISAISLGGSGKIIGQNTIESDELSLSVSGSGSISIEVEADRLEQKISGSGNINVSGVADDMEVSVSGSGNLDAFDLEVDHCSVRISGSGKCRVNAGDYLEADISGSGSVYYKGEPDRIRSNVSGSGKVRPY